MRSDGSIVLENTTIIEVWALNWPCTSEHTTSTEYLEKESKKKKIIIHWLQIEVALNQFSDERVHHQQDCINIWLPSHIEHCMISLVTNHVGLASTYGCIHNAHISIVGSRE